MKKLLLLNLGSTSLKMKLHRLTETEEVLTTGEVDNIGCENSKFHASVG